MGSPSNFDDLNPLVDLILERLFYEHLDGALRTHAVGAGTLHGAVDLGVLDIDDLDVTGVLGELGPDIGLDDLLDPLVNFEGRHLRRGLGLGRPSHGQHRKLFHGGGSRSVDLIE